MIGIILFGGTGSIGKQTLEIINNKEYKLLAFTFNNNISFAKQIIQEYKPFVVGISNINHQEELLSCDKNINIVLNNQVNDIIEYDYSKHLNLEKILYINALSGSAGLYPTYEIINHGYDLLLANKESLVMAGKIIMDLARIKNVNIIPIDSEHSGLQKILLGKDKKDVNSLIITASGGALRDYIIEDLKDVTAKDALKHPNWLMGKDITINCATMMNKGYEVIEACHLFNMDIDKVKVLVHKESIIHALVEFNDGTIEANLGTADMRNPISFAVNYPHFKDNNLSKLDLIKVASLNFKELDLNRYPCFNLAIKAYKLGGYYPTILNAANEAAVKLFLNNEINYLDIYHIVNDMLNKHNNYLITKEELSIENIIKLDREIQNDVLKFKKGCEQ